jgi:hypothetical protein
VQAGADPKSVQGQMRHSRISTTLDIYAQIVPESQRQALRKLSQFVASNCDHAVTDCDQQAAGNDSQGIENFGGASRDRTDDLIVANDALSQLSYSPI